MKTHNKKWDLILIVAISQIIRWDQLIIISDIQQTVNHYFRELKQPTSHNTVTVYLKTQAVGRWPLTECASKQRPLPQVTAARLKN